MPLGRRGRRFKSCHPDQYNEKRPPTAPLLAPVSHRDPGATLTQSPLCAHDGRTDLRINIPVRMPEHRTRECAMQEAKILVVGATSKRGDAGRRINWLRLRAGLPELADMTIRTLQRRYQDALRAIVSELTIARLSSLSHKRG